MTIAEWMILAAVLIYLLTIAPFKPLGYRDFDNAKPRDAEFYKDPLRTRAWGAHQAVERFDIVVDALEQHALTDQRDTGIDEARNGAAGGGRKLARMIGVQRDDTCDAGCDQGGDEVVRDA